MTLRAAASDDSADRQRFRALWADHYADVLGRGRTHTITLHLSQPPAP